MVERRRHPRLRLEVDVDLESESTFYVARSQDLSEGGLFIATDATLPIGRTLEVSFKLGERRIALNAEVAWALTHDDDTPHGMGVRFVDPLPEEREAILAFMREREPMLFESIEAEPVARPPGPAPKPAKP